jgi:hypothetical protein
MEAFDSPEEKLFARLVEQYPPRTVPVLKIAAAFAMMVAAVALACFGLLMAVAG